MKLFHWFVGAMVALYALIAPAIAQAAVDVAPLVAEIEANKDPMISVGTAMLGLVVVVVLFMMVRRVLR